MLISSSSSMATNQFLKCINLILINIIVTVYKNIRNMCKTIGSFQLFNNVFSEFVKEMLIRGGIREARELDDIVEPMHFLTLPNANHVYSGKLKDFANK